jgi:hypothetical protein
MESGLMIESRHMQQLLCIEKSVAIEEGSAIAPQIIARANVAAVWCSMRHGRMEARELQEGKATEDERVSH